MSHLVTDFGYRGAQVIDDLQTAEWTLDVTLPIITPRFNYAEEVNANLTEGFNFCMVSKKKNYRTA